jgi:hypothetical protein
VTERGHSAKNEARTWRGFSCFCNRDLLDRRSLAIFQARESSDNPRVKAFCRVAPTVLFKVRAILSACVFCRASVFNVRTCSVVHACRFDCLFINFLQDRKPVVTKCFVEQCQFAVALFRDMINGLIHPFGSSVASAFLTFDWEIPNCRAILAGVMPALKAARTAFI